MGSKWGIRPRIPLIRSKNNQLNYPKSNFHQFSSICSLINFKQRNKPTRTWKDFAIICAFSSMVSPIPRESASLTSPKTATSTRQFWSGENLLSKSSSWASLSAVTLWRDRLAMIRLISTIQSSSSRTTSRLSLATNDYYLTLHAWFYKVLN